MKCLVGQSSAGKDGDCHNLIGLDHTSWWDNKAIGVFIVVGVLHDGSWDQCAVPAVGHKTDHFVSMEVQHELLHDDICGTI